MSTMNLPLEIYQRLERRLGAEDAMAVTKSIEDALTHLEERSKEVSLQRKLEVREELRIEMRDELATKADMASLRGEIQADLAKLQGYVDTRFERLDKKFTLMFGVLVFLIIFLNQNALEFILKVVGILK